MDDHHLTPEEVAHQTDSRTVRWGLWLFAVYLAAYIIYILLATFAPESMKAVVPGGVNLAVAYGFGLIALALVLAVVYLVKAGKRS